jgi:Skp family chaperone for outer membrane proteins
MKKTIKRIGLVCLMCVSSISMVACGAKKTAPSTTTKSKSAKEQVQQALACATLKVGFVSLQKIAAKDKTFQESLSAFQQKVKSTREKLSGEEDKILKEKSDLEGQKSLINSSQFNAAQTKYYARVKKFEQEVAAVQQKFSEQDRTINEKLQTDIQKVIDSIGGSNGYDFILTDDQGSQQLIYAKPKYIKTKLDLSQTVIDQLNQ